MTHLPHPEYQHVVLLRHAETDANAKGIVQGHLNTSPLRRDVPDSLVDAVLALEEEAGPLKAVYTTDSARGFEPALDLYRKIVLRITGAKDAEDADRDEFDFPGYSFNLNFPTFSVHSFLKERNLGGYQGQSYDLLIPPTPGQIVDKAVRRSQLIKILRELDDNRVMWGRGESLATFKHRVGMIATLFIRPSTGYRIIMSHMGILDHVLDELGDVMPNGQYRWANNLQGYHLVLKDRKLVEKRDFTPDIVYPDAVPVSR